MQTEEDDAFEMVHSSNAGSEEDFFDNAVSCMQDIMLEGDIEERLSSFCREHCAAFDDAEEHKLAHTEIFHQYVELLETQLESACEARLPGFDMASFIAILARISPDQLQGDLFDMLLSVSDYPTFKAHMLSYKCEEKLLDLWPTVSGVLLS